MPLFLTHARKKKISEIFNTKAQRKISGMPLRLSFYFVFASVR